MVNMERIHQAFGEKHFAGKIGCEIISVTPEKTVCRLRVTDQHANATGNVQGGVIFTLGDFTFAVAANAFGKVTVTLNSSISYLKAARGTELLATAEQITRSSRVCVYEVKIIDNLGTHVAQMTVTGYVKETDNGMA